MATFTYQARDESGRLVKGVLEADSQTALAERLRKMGYLVTRIEQKGLGFGAAILFPRVRRTPQEPLLLAAIQLSNLVEAGVPLVSALKALVSQTSHPALKEAFESASREVEGGSPFSEALSRNPIFPKLMVSLTAVGEASGHLDVVLSRFANFLEKDLTLRRALQGALLYPALLLVAATALILFVVTFVVPQFAALFAKVGIPLPLPTQVLRTIGETIRSQWAFLVILAGVAIAGLSFAVKVPAIRQRIDEWLLKLPIVGAVIHQAIVARFTRTLGTLVGSGVPILSALETAKGVVGNHLILKEVERVRQAVERGERMHVTLSVGKVFYPDAVQMIRVGEESGRLDSMLDRIADFYELRVNFYVRQMTTVLEPILLVVMGGIVAFIMASLLLPMFDMVKVLQRGGIR